MTLLGRVWRFGVGYRNVGLGVPTLAQTCPTSPYKPAEGPFGGALDVGLKAVDERERQMAAASVR